MQIGRVTTLLLSVVAICCEPRQTSTRSNSTPTSAASGDVLEPQQQAPVSEADFRAIEAAKRYLEASDGKIPSNVRYSLARANGECIVHVVEPVRIHVIDAGGTLREAIPLHGYERDVRMTEPSLQPIQILAGP